MICSTFVISTTHLSYERTHWDSQEGRIASRFYLAKQLRLFGNHWNSNSQGFSVDAWVNEQVDLEVGGSSILRGLGIWSRSLSLRTQRLKQMRCYCCWFESSWNSFGSYLISKFLTWLMCLWLLKVIAVSLDYRCILWLSFLFVLLWILLR